MPYVSVRMLKGRTKDQKKELAQAITKALAEICGARREGTTVVIDEVDRENWAIGGELMSERG